MAAAFAAAHPQRVSSLVLHATRAKYGAPVDGYPFGYGTDELDPYVEWYESGWGTEAFAREFLEWVAPSVAQDPAEVEAYVAVMRAAGDGETVAAAVRQTYAATDVRDALPAIACPALVTGRRDDEVTPIDEVRWLAAHVPGATLLELDGADHPIWAGDATTIVGRVETLVMASA
jgi:pimeloyl-ACP methyl ester carboxylesterase